MKFLSEPPRRMSCKPDTPLGELMKILNLAQQEENSIDWFCELTLGDKVKDLLFARGSELQNMDIRGFVIGSDGNELRVRTNRQISDKECEVVFFNLSTWLQLPRNSICIEYIETTEL
jgi:hypothetical protein